MHVNLYFWLENLGSFLGKYYKKNYDLEYENDSFQEEKETFEKFSSYANVDERLARG